MTGKRKKRKIRLDRVLMVAAGVLLILIVIGLVVRFVSGSKPTQPKQLVVMLDNAHGGDNSGYQGIINEDEYNEHVIDELQLLLDADERFKAVRTHEDGQAMAVSTRVERINEESPDLVLSVRCHNGDSPHFTTTLIFADPPASKYHDRSKEFASAIQETFTADGYAPLVGYYYYTPIKTGYYQEHLVALDDETDYEEETYELMSAKAPVVIVSQINVNSEEETAEWGNEEGWKKAADIYYRALSKMVENES